MIPDVDVFISNYTIVDPEVYQLWVDGCTGQYKIKNISTFTILLTLRFVK